MSIHDVLKGRKIHLIEYCNGYESRMSHYPMVIYHSITDLVLNKEDNVIEILSDISKPEKLDEWVIGNEDAWGISDEKVISKFYTHAMTYVDLGPTRVELYNLIETINDKGEKDNFIEFYNITFYT